MSISLSFLIRDGLQSDIDACIKLDHTIQTEYVWQMTVRDLKDQKQIIFKTERLPRMMEIDYPTDERRLQLAIPGDQCFLVAAASDEQNILGYLTMRQDPVHRRALIQDLVIARPYRRIRIGTRLLKVARQWTREHNLRQLTAETHTKNYPGVQFCQKMGLAFSGYNDHYFSNQDIAIFFTQTLR